MHTAGELRAIAQKKLDEEQTDMNAWVENLSQSIINWCEEDADKGKMKSTLDSSDLEVVLDADIPPDRISQVVYGAKNRLEDLSYKITVNDIDPRTKSPGEYIHGMTIDWSGK